MSNGTFLVDLNCSISGELGFEIFFSVKCYNIESRPISDRRRKNQLIVENHWTFNCDYSSYTDTKQLQNSRRTWKVVVKDDVLWSMAWVQHFWDQFFSLVENWVNNNSIQLPPGGCTKWMMRALVGQPSAFTYIIPWATFRRTRNDWGRRLRNYTGARACSAPCEVQQPD